MGYCRDQCESSRVSPTGAGADGVVDSEALGNARKSAVSTAQLHTSNVEDVLQRHLFQFSVLCECDKNRTLLGRACRPQSTERIASRWLREQDRSDTLSPRVGIAQIDDHSTVFDVHAYLISPTNNKSKNDLPAFKNGFDASQVVGASAI